MPGRDLNELVAARPLTANLIHELVGVFSVGIISAAFDRRKIFVFELRPSTGFDRGADCFAAGFCAEMRGCATKTVPAFGRDVMIVGDRTNVVTVSVTLRARTPTIRPRVFDEESASVGLLCARPNHATGFGISGGELSFEPLVCPHEAIARCGLFGYRIRGRARGTAPGKVDTSFFVRL